MNTALEFINNSYTLNNIIHGDYREESEFAEELIANMLIEFAKLQVSNALSTIENTIFLEIDGNHSPSNGNSIMAYDQNGDAMQIRVSNQVIDNYDYDSIT